MKTPLARSLALLALSLTAQAAPQDSAPSELGEWPQWRGPERDGQFTGPDWPATLDEEHLVPAWTVSDLGPSYSSPVVTLERVFTTETVDKEREVVRAFDRTSGAQLWTTSWEGALEVPFFAARNGSWIRSTPAYDGECLYVAGMRDVLVCLTADEGEVRWRVDFVEQLGTAVPPFGMVCSPLLDGDFVYVQAASSVVKLDKRSGEIVWRAVEQTENAMEGGAFSSPVLARVAGRTQLLVQSRAALAGLAPEDGAVLWSLPIKSFRGMNILTPALHDGALFTSSYGGGSQLVAVAEQQGSFHATPRWQNRAQGYMTSPVIVSGYAYVFMRSNRFSCIDLASGEDRWTSPPTGDSYWSLAAQGDRILALSDTGLLRLVRADPTHYEVLSERQVANGETWAHVAPAGRQLFVRELHRLLAFDWK